MIRKNTLAIFYGGDYAGEYDWEGGVPLTVGENITVTLNDKSTDYNLKDKQTTLTDSGVNQEVLIKYYFEVMS